MSDWVDAITIFLERLPARDSPALIAARLLGLLLTVPVFSSRILPFRLRLALSAVLAFSVARGPTEPSPAMVEGPRLLDPASAPLLLASEIFAGVCLGWLGFLLLGAIRGAAVLVSDQIGFSLGASLDPSVSAEPALRGFHAAFSFHIFLSLDFHHACLRAAARSLEIFPPGALGREGGFEDAGFALLSAGGGLFEAALILSFPLTAALLLASLVQGIVLRVFPELEFFLFGFPARALIGMGVMAASLPLIAEICEGAFSSLEGGGLDIFRTFAG